MSAHHWSGKRAKPRGTSTKDFMKDDAGFVDQGCLGFEAAPSKCQGSKRDCKRISRFPVEIFWGAL